MNMNGMLIVDDILTNNRLNLDRIYKEQINRIHKDSEKCKVIHIFTGPFNIKDYPGIKNVR